VLAAALSGCGDGDADVTWEHIFNDDPLMSTVQDIADQWAEQSGLTIDVQPTEVEAFKSRMSTLAQSGSLPDVFHTWGGGVLAEQVDAGLVRDLTDDVDCLDKVNPAALDPYMVDGRLYAVPIDQGVVGFWYNMDLFDQAGIGEPPATWSAFLDAVEALKAADITPIALAGGDQWPTHYYWTYLAMRTAGLDGLEAAAEAGDFSDDAFVEAGQLLADLAAMEPFQPGFEGAGYGEVDGQAAHMGEGLAAMELMGQWAPQVQREASGTDGPGEALGFFPFPEVEGGAGRVTEFLGGGGGFAAGSDSPDEIVDLMCAILDEENQARMVEDGNLSTVAADPEKVAPEADPHIQLVIDAMGTATGVQLYPDQAYPAAVGSVINESSEGLVLGHLSPQDFVDRVNDAWATGG
jgi:raffinose/stachyose/melibiose transport system substrate-binding protein